jgi:hypothetical protein
MNLIEDRIRAAARAAADTVTPDSVPPLELPPPRPDRHDRWFRWNRRAGTSWAIRLAPAAAALAVLVIAIAMVSVSHPDRYGTSSGGSSASVAGPPGVPAGPPVETYLSSGQVPRYYVQVTPRGGTADAVVHLTADGGTAATIRAALPHGAVVAVASAGDGRTFVLAEQEAGQDRTAISFYEVRLSPSGYPGTQAKLRPRVPAGTWMTGLALSAGGSRLAIATQGGDVQQVTVYPIGGAGHARTWSAHGGTVGTPFDTRSLSWTADQRTLAFDWSSGGTMSVRVLRTDSSKGNLLTASRPAVTLGNKAGPGKTTYLCPGNSVITPDGSAIVCSGTQFTNIAPGGTVRYSTGFVEFSVATGLPIRILGHWNVSLSAGPRVMDVLWSGASGRVLIGMIKSADRDWVGIVSGNRFTPLDVRWDPAAPDLGTW